MSSLVDQYRNQGYNLLVMTTFERSIFIGDVHGCVVELLTLLGGLNVKPHKDRVIFLGDLPDKGPDSLGALRLARQTIAQLPGSLCILGNHEKKWLRKIDRGQPPPEAEGITDLDLAFLRSMPLFQRFPDIGCFAVHGGVFPKLLEALGTLEDADAVYPHPDKKRGKLVEKVAHTRQVDKNGDFVPLDKESERGVGHWSKTYDGSLGYVLFGHQPEREPIVTMNALGLDTGCCYGWSLTAAIVRGPEDRPEIVSVPAFKQYAVHRNEEE